MSNPLIRFRGPIRLTGLRISAGIAAIETLEISPEGRLTPYPPGCATLLLAGRRQIDTMALRKEFKAFCRFAGIREIYLRGSPEKGSYSGHPLAFKLEAAIDLIAGIEVIVIPTLRVSRWAFRQEYPLPAPIGTMLSEERKLHDQAIEVAAYVAVMGRSHAIGQFDPRGVSHDLLVND